MKFRYWFPTVIVFAAVATTIAPEQKLLDDTVQRYRAGRASLQLAIEAIGGYSNLSAFKDMSFTFQGVGLARGQSAAHDVDYTALPAAGKVVFNSSGRIAYDYMTQLRGGRDLHLRRVFDSDSGWTHRVIENELTEMSAFDRGFVMSNPGLYPVDAIPHSLILTALANAGSIRAFDSDMENGTVSIALSSKTGAARTLVINAATGLPERVEYVTSDPIKGDTQGEVHFSEYQTVAGLRIPHRLAFTQEGESLGHWTLSDIAINSSPSDEVFDRPDIELTQHATAFQPVRVANGVYAVRLYSGLGFTYNTMLVEFDDYMAVIEAPLSDFFYPVVKGIADKLAPGKSIKYVVSTHYHFDHTNGLKAYLAHGVTVLTVPDNAEYLKLAARTDHTLLPNPLRGKDGPLAIESIGREKILSTDSQTMRLIDVGPNPHVDQILVAYIPGEKVLFVSDLISTFDGGYVGEPTEALAALNGKLDELGIEAETIVPGHGPAIKGDDLRRALGKQL